MRLWTKREIQILKKSYHRDGSTELSRQLNRSQQSIWQKAGSLKLKKTETTAKTYKGLKADFRKKLKKLDLEKSFSRCWVCDYDRSIDLAHILERKNGGGYSIENIAALCPNCHRNFDQQKLTLVEALKLYLSHVEIRSIDRNRAR